MSHIGDAHDWTANGELATRTHVASGAQLTTVYDSHGNLREATLPDGRVVAYTADGFHRRVQKRINGTLVQQFLYLNQLEPIAELDGAGNVVANFVYADRAHVPSLMRKDSRWYRIVSDQLGSVRLVVDLTDGTIAQRLDYDEFGRVLTDTAPGFQPFGYAGGIYDRDTGLVRFGARDYDPETGRWTAKDPIRFGGGYGNLFVYVRNNPMNRLDPTGLADCDVDIALDLLEDSFPDADQPDLDYPERRNIRFRNLNINTPPGEVIHAVANPVTNEVTLDIRYQADLNATDARKLLDTLVHESMHLPESVVENAFMGRDRYEDAYHPWVHQRAADFAGLLEAENQRRRSACGCGAK